MKRIQRGGRGDSAVSHQFTYSDIIVCITNQYLIVRRLSHCIEYMNSLMYCFELFLCCKQIKREFEQRKFSAKTMDPTTFRIQTITVMHWSCKIKQVQFFIWKLKEIVLLLHRWWWWWWIKLWPMKIMSMNEIDLKYCCDCRLCL